MSVSKPRNSTSVQLKVLFVVWSWVYLLSVSDVDDVKRNPFASSVWCGQRNYQLVTCHFRNLCYDPNHGFLFALHESSSISGLNNYEDFQNLKLSPVADHKGVNMKITTVRSSHFPFDGIHLIEEPHFLLFRFKPDNLMHVFHDDLIPLFAKFQELSAGTVSRFTTSVNLFFADLNDNGPFLEYYKPLTSKVPMLAKDLPQPVCFSSSYVGPANTSFFQYGFGKPQGPIGPNLKGNDVVEFKRHILDHFHLDVRKDDSLKITLLTRAINRKIVNEDKLVDMMTSAVGEIFPGKTVIVDKVDMLSNNTMDVIVSCASSDVMIAMHGAETILSIFLPESSVFVELFPFGVLRDNVSPVYCLSRTPGIHFRYLSWHNTKEGNSIGHPEYPREFGGLMGFADRLKRDIYATKQVPPVPCCDNPYYLFRMYQDTIVDDTFSDVAAAAVKLLSSKSTGTNHTKWFFPGPVSKLKCEIFRAQALITWKAPFNLPSSEVTYNVSVLAGSLHQNVVTKNVTLRVDLSNHITSTAQVWVTCELRGVSSVDSYCECN